MSMYARYYGILSVCDFLNTLSWFLVFNCGVIEPPLYFDPNPVVSPTEGTTGKSMKDGDNGMYPQVFREWIQRGGEKMSDGGNDLNSRGNWEDEFGWARLRSTEAMKRGWRGIGMSPTGNRRVIGWIRRRVRMETVWAKRRGRGSAYLNLAENRGSDGNSFAGRKGRKGNTQRTFSAYG